MEKECAFERLPSPNESYQVRDPPVSWSYRRDIAARISNIEPLSLALFRCRTTEVRSLTSYRRTCDTYQRFPATSCGLALNPGSRPKQSRVSKASKHSSAANHRSPKSSRSTANVYGPSADKGAYETRLFTHREYRQSKNLRHLISTWIVYLIVGQSCAIRTSLRS